MQVDYQDLASPMNPDETYIRGELWKPVKTWKWLWTKKPEQRIDEETVTFHLTGKVLYVGTLDHQISQVIFRGKKNTYVYDTTKIRLHHEEYQEYYEHIPIPLQDMEEDTYNIYLMYQDSWYDSGQEMRIGSSS